MPASHTARFLLPLLAISQAHKEVTHNEALVRIDALLHAVVEDRLAQAPAAVEGDLGKCWLVDDGASGDWSGRSGQIAIWVGADWRYAGPTEGMRVRSRASESDLVYVSGNWISAPAIADPSGGPTVDAEARIAIKQLLDHFRTIGHVTR
jgi:Protein of unknown function (DUF2793)